MKVFVILGLVAISISAVCSITIHDISEEWNLFKVKFNKVYENVGEELFRKKLYLKNKIVIEEHNKLYKKGQATYKLKMNQFGDMANHEWKDMNGFNQILKNNIDDRDSVTYLSPENVNIPSSIDWRELGAVTPVKDQGHKCGSCWAFSSTGSIEGQQFRKTGKLVSLSEQNLIDCSRRFGNDGCRGGLMVQSFNYIKFNGGIDTEISYPYKGRNGFFCKYKSTNKGATVSGFVNIQRGDENTLAKAVATVGPVSIAIDASLDNFRFYDEGVFYEPTCSSVHLDHGVLAVGYNTTEAGEDYWIVKNSWGEEWGQGGYIWMARNKNNNCGIASMASYPLV
ncbi:Cathepsin propeptide inhibitor domain (I29),Cysteine peptidase, asparagine active site,Cysteine [Cinara cedri]|uniref:Cathepsin propeptide inhibitor domain (I29),Cysteine peptidase, asparagine active site,Cysteine n=1 Tax=Cinara cedri TaxID=506608 RepID=A0A5E4MEC0_9HEMI|nr:Cathepsin propeptide inhibitor domain (I29),Cysteine peptidase, asparagine active site,Cysteine [Cinara cedri]